MQTCHRLDVCANPQENVRWMQGGVTKGWRDRAVSDLIILLGRRWATRCMWQMVGIEKISNQIEKYVHLEGTRFLVTLAPVI